MSSRTSFLSALLDRDRARGAAALLVGGPGLGKSAVLEQAAGLARSSGYAVMPATTGIDLDHVRRTIRERPMLITVDDLDRADPAVAAHVLACTDAFRDHPVAFLLTSSSSSLAALGRLTEHRLRPLGITAAAELLRQQRTPVTGRARYEVLRRSAGNPRALLALNQAFGTGGAPDTRYLQTQYRDRLAALPEPTRRALLYAAARLGREPLSTVLAAAGVAGNHPQVWKSAIAARLVEVGSDLTFRDPLVAIALYYAAPAATRRQVHSDLAAAGPATYEGAMHRGMLPLGADAATADLLEKQSWKARSRSRMAQAAVAAQRAAELSPHDQDAVRRYLLAAAATTGAADPAWTRELAAIVRRRTVQPELRYTAAITTAAALAREGRQHEAMDLLTATVRGGPPADCDVAVSVTVCAAAVAAQSGLPQHRHAAVDVLRAGEGAPVVNSAGPFLYRKDLTLQAAQTAVWIDHRRAGEYKPLLVSHLDQAGRLAVGDVLALATIADALGETEQAVALRWRVLRRPAAERTRHPEGWPAMIGGLLALGRWRQAEVALRSADNLARAHDLTTLRVHLVALRATLAALRGDVEHTRALLDRAWSQLDLSCNRPVYVQFLQAAGYAGLTSGDYAAAARNFTEAIGLAEPTGTLPPDGLSALGLAMAARRTGTVVEAIAVLESVRAISGDEVPMRMLLLLSQAEALLVDDGRTEDRFRFAVDHPDAPTWLPTLALARLHYGAWLRRRRRPIEARAQLTGALTAFTELGAAELARFARGELSATGDDAGENPASPAESFLTTRQRQVARLAAAGLRNSQIAEQLQLSARTVNTHLHNAYQRLAITRRDQLRAILAVDPGGRRTGD